jgi:tetratricopeptide (TPR) repeat protein
LAYFNRGTLRRDRLEWAQALADFDEAIRLDARDPNAHYHRGIVLFARRRGGAADEAKAALDLQGWRGDLSMYAVLLGQAAARRDGQPDRARSLLDEAAKKCDASAWPYPIIRHLRGELNEAALLAAADDDGKRTEARCHLGLEALEQGRRETAIAHFRWVKEGGNRRGSHYAVSIAELDRLLAKGAEGDGP